MSDFQMTSSREDFQPEFSRYFLSFHMRAACLTLRREVSWIMTGSNGMFLRRRGQLVAYVTSGHFFMC
jgi:hypothetical protein